MIKAGFSIRLAAWLIDLIIISILSFISVYIYLKTGKSATNLVAGGFMILSGLIITSYIFSSLFYLLEILTGKTIGKMIFALVVGMEDGNKSTIKARAIRGFIKSSGFSLFILAAVFGIELLGLLGKFLGLIIFFGCFSVLDNKKQAFHDMLSKTAVFKNS